VRVIGQVWPKAWDVSSTFGSVAGVAAAYRTPGGDKAPTLALRAGGKKVFGSYPTSVYGNADLRIYISQMHILVTGTWGILGFGDVGRVYYNPESSNKWHKGYGGGLWFAWLDRANTLSVSYARSEGHNGFYARAGFAF